MENRNANLYDYLNTFSRGFFQYINNCICRKNVKPFMLTVLLTTKCSSNCPHCFRIINSPSEKNNIEMKKETIINISSKKIPIVLLSGGEPSECSMLKFAIELFQCNNSKVFVMTNGMNPRLLEEHISSANKRKLRIIISFSSFDNEHRINQKVKTLQLLFESSYRTYVNITIQDFEPQFIDGLLTKILPYTTRVHMNKHVIAYCAPNLNDFNTLKEAAQYIKEKYDLFAFYQKPINKVHLFLLKVASFLQGSRFDPCSGFPFRATINELGQLKMCLLKNLEEGG